MDQTWMRTLCEFEQLLAGNPPTSFSFPAITEQMKSNLEIYLTRGNENSSFPWDLKKMHVDDIFSLILCADVHNLHRLKDLACGALAERTKGKTKEEVGRCFGFDPVSDEVDALIRNANPWGHSVISEV